MLGARIAALRREAGLSQAELSKRLGISASAMGMYEQGRREPPLDIVVSLSEILQVSTDYLLTGKPASAQEEKRVSQNLLDSVMTAEDKLKGRSVRPFSRDELAVLFAAMLLEP
ncbi:MAG: helix-turn-helix domain-containing protein [Faecousia sp.]